MQRALAAPFADIILSNTIQGVWCSNCNDDRRSAARRCGCGRPTPATTRYAVDELRSISVTASSWIAVSCVGMLMVKDSYSIEY